MRCITTGDNLCNKLQNDKYTANYSEGLYAGMDYHLNWKNHVYRMQYHNTAPAKWHTLCVASQRKFSDMNTKQRAGGQI
jgi:hypothetical protein